MPIRSPYIPHIIPQIIIPIITMPNVTQNMYRHLPSEVMGWVIVSIR